MSETPVVPTYSQVDRSIRRLKDIEPENTFLPESFDANLERLGRIYGAVKPLLTMLATLPIIPSTWRRAIDMINQAVDAVVAGAGTITAKFKAGRDL